MFRSTVPSGSVWVSSIAFRPLTRRYAVGRGTPIASPISAGVIGPCSSSISTSRRVFVSSRMGLPLGITVSLRVAQTVSLQVAQRAPDLPGRTLYEVSDPQRRADDRIAQA